MGNVTVLHSTGPPVERRLLDGLKRRRFAAAQGGDDVARGAWVLLWWGQIDSFLIC